MRTRMEEAEARLRQHFEGSGDALVMHPMWAWILAKLAEGAVQKIGAEIADALLGDFFGRSPDIESIMDDFAKELLVAIQQMLHENEVRKLFGSVNTATTLVNEYGATDDVSYLIKADDELRSAAEQFRTLPLAGHDGLMVATTMRITVISIQEEATGKSDTPRKALIAKRGVEDFDKARGTWEEWANAQLVGPLGPTVSPRRPDPSRIDLSLSFGYKDRGKYRRLHHQSCSHKIENWAGAQGDRERAQLRQACYADGRREAEAKLVALRSDFVDETLSKRVSPYGPTVEGWRKLAALV